MSFFLLLKTKDDHFEEWVTKQLMGSIDFQSTMEVNGPINCLVTNIPQNIFFCVHQKKEIPEGL